MAPLRIRCVVSFSSQDPKYPVENLLLEEGVQPWLCCPLDRSRQLRAELQLEQAACIGYIDVGNSGSAFLQIEVGRSSWPPGQDYLTLLPTTTLMVPADAKWDRNRSGVRMFKEGDLLAPALAEKWDRVRLTCSQPFHRHAQFGLAFIRLRTPEDTEESQGAPAAPSPGQPSPVSAPRPGVSSGVFGGTLPPAGPSPSPREERLLKRQLQELDSTLRGLSRPAQLVLKAAASARKRAPLPPAREASPSPRAPRPKEEQPARSSCLKTKRRRSQGGTRRWPQALGPSQLPVTKGPSCDPMGMPQRPPRNGSQREERAHSQRAKPPTWESEEEEGESRGGAALGTCPICAGCFPAEFLPIHASTCGEEVEGARASPSPAWGSWVECPLCQGRFPASEVESHASGCREEDA